MSVEDPIYEDEMAVSDVLAAVFRWAEEHGVSDESLLGDATGIARRWVQESCDIKQAFDEATSYLDSYLD